VLGQIKVDLIAPTTPFRRYPAKAAEGLPFVVRAELVSDPHVRLAAIAELREGAVVIDRAALSSDGNDLWQGWLCAPSMGRAEVVVRARFDRYRTWLERTRRRPSLELQVVDFDDFFEAIDHALVAGARIRANLPELRILREHRRSVSELLASGEIADALERCGSELVVQSVDAALAEAYPEASAPAPVIVERSRALFGSWYEAFPRSFDGLDSMIPLLGLLKARDFDVLYLPPIHPIGRTGRKGKNNALSAAKDDVGSPWAIGSVDGGHDEVAPELGGIAAFRRLMNAAREMGIEIALDLALQCSPDHPWLNEHPEWFRIRSDGTIATAENPPKKYQDIVPIEFYPSVESDRVALWEEIRRVVEYWIGEGVRIFRVDNPHTKPLALWEWLIGEIRARHDGVIFLAEAFTRPRVMRALAEVGFSQSYTYFTWRDSPWELREYATEVHDPIWSGFMRPNFWPTTPDILAGRLRGGGRRDFELRALLAATISPSTGIYAGYEFLENSPQSESNEEFADSEKYELKRRRYGKDDLLGDYLAMLNRARRQNKSLRLLSNIHFLGSTNPQILAFVRTEPEDDNLVLVVANFDTQHVQDGGIYLSLGQRFAEGRRYRFFDYVRGGPLELRGGHNYVRLDPQSEVAHLLQLTGEDE
jgi:starch synthase (maltosyl-transferring)